MRRQIDSHDRKSCGSSWAFCYNQPGHRQHRNNKTIADVIHKHFMERLKTQQIQNRIRYRHLKMQYLQMQSNRISLWIKPGLFLAWFGMFIFTMLGAPTVVIFARTLLELHSTGRLELLHPVSQFIVIFPVVR